MNDYKPFDKPIENAPDWTTREVFDSLNDEDQRLFMFNILEDQQNVLFQQQQMIDHL